MIKKIFCVFFVLFVIGLASVIPIIKMYGKLNIGNDIILPIIPEFSFHTGYEWVESANGIYSANEFFTWSFMFFLLKKIGLNLYQAGFAFQFIINFLSGLGVYAIFNLFNNKNRLFGLIAAVGFIYSPYRYDHMPYFYATTTSIWLFYFLFKFLRNKKFSLFDVASIGILFGFLGNLPNPKYHFLIFLTYVISLIVSVVIQYITFKDLKNNLKYFLLLLIGTSHLSLRLMNYALTFSQNSTIAIKATSVLQDIPHAFDYGSAFTSQMIRLWHSPGINAPEQTIMTTPIFIAGYYLLPLLVLGLFPLLLKTFSLQQRKIYFIFYVLAVFFVFLAKSANPPFGFIYDWLVVNVKLFAFMRSSAGMVIYAGIFYALIFAIVIQSLFYRLKKYGVIALLLFLFVVMVPGYHLWKGTYSLNFSVNNPFISKKEYGLKVPEDYFKSAYRLDQIKLDSKLDIIVGSRGYQNNSWGYYGFLIYPWYINMSILSFDKLVPGELKYSFFNNAMYFYNDKTLLSDVETTKAILDKYHFAKVIFSSPDVEILRKTDETFLPHFFIESNNHGNVSLEFKKIDPTKYRIRIHKASGTIQLAFTDNYDKQWLIYPGNQIQNPVPDDNDTAGLVNKSYRLLPGNDDDQATKQELMSFIQSGKISTLGDLKAKEKKYYEYSNNKEKLTHIEKYNIDFVAKEFLNTIQNDNLPVGGLFETLLKKPVQDGVKHEMLKGFANQWIIDSDELCKSKSTVKCINNSDGSYDFEIVVEFWPQRLAYIGFILSSITVLLCLLKTVIDKK